MTVKVEAVAQGQKLIIVMEIECEALCQQMRNLILAKLCSAPTSLSYLTVSE